MSKISKLKRNYWIQRARMRANQLISRGQHREAINHLQIENRKLRSSEIENLLVQLRHDAFFAINHGTPQGIWLGYPLHAESQAGIFYPSNKLNF